ncbi:LysR substrate-binding domain-containing protein [Labrenzia sp. 011]|uniref:LysR substrate-binding domain-containing protein n=1 Tax=Labrenzia sp. 011 TaxID=2171494 RepID=UPI000D50EBF7|nr:LysR substrate-binding domain-containing protein [Labrenzia sp. 011]PVB59939.1 LysR family transcriptional regulator [Labrenzia sp. 011]
MRSLPNLLWLRSFEAASRLGSFTAAGGELGLTQAAVSTHISALETQLGHQLLERTTRKVGLTAAGSAYLPSVRKALQDLALSTEGLFGKRTAGTVTIRAPISEAALIIAPALAAFQQEHPELRIRLLSAIWADTILESGIDIEIRLGTGSWPGTHAEPLGTEVIVPVCAPDLAATIRHPRQLLDHPRIHVLGFDDHWPRFLETIGQPPETRQPGVTVDTSLAAVELAAARGGTTLLLGKIASRLTENGRLAIPYDLEIPSLQTHFLLTRDNAAAPKAATGMVEAWLRELFA